MGTVRFEMSGRRFEIDPEAPLTLLDLDVLSETRVDPTAVGQMLVAVADRKREPDVEAVRAIGALAYLAAVRAGSNDSWREFARAMDPQTLRFTDEAAPEVAAPTASDEAALAQRVADLIEARKTA